MATHILEVEDLKGYYRGVFGVVRAIDGVSFNLDRGKIMGIAGESGGGKSTLAQLVSGTPPPLLHHEGGRILVDGIDIYNIDPEQLRTEVKCKRMSYVPQASMESLNPVKRIRDFIFDVVEQRLPVQGFGQKRIGPGSAGIPDIRLGRMPGHGRDVYMSRI